MPIGIFLSEAIRSYDVTRKDPGGLIGRVRRALRDRLLPNVRTEVRGNVVAAETLVEALISHGTMDRYEVFVHPWFRSAAYEKLKSYSIAKDNAKRVGISSVDNVLRTGTDKYRLTAWFNPLPTLSPQEGIELSQRIRKCGASRLYPVTMLAHGLSRPQMLYDYFLRIILEGTYPCDSIICTSRASHEAARKIFAFVAEEFNREIGARIKYNGRLDLIPLCVDCSKLRPQDKSKVRDQLKLPKDAFRILYVGRLSPLKADLHPFLRVFQSLVRQNPTRKLLWVITGSEDKGYTRGLLEQARALGVSDYIKTMLNISDKAKELLIPAADACISPIDCVMESFGLTPVEAMACGVPQVMSDWDGYRDTISHGETGFLVPTHWSNCHHDLADAGSVVSWIFDHFCLGQSVAVDLGKTREYLQCLIENEQLRHEMARQSRQRALSLYSFEAVVKRYEELWLELSEIAFGIKIDAPSCYFSRPLYYEFFEHYASKALSDGISLRITPVGKEMVSADKYLPTYQDVLSSLKILDENVLRRALEELASQCEPNGGPESHKTPDGGCQVPLGELVQRMARHHSYSSDYLRRHVMWLIKYGCLEPMIEPLGKERR